MASDRETWWEPGPWFAISMSRAAGLGYRPTIVNETAYLQLTKPSVPALLLESKPPRFIADLRGPALNSAPSEWTEANAHLMRTAPALYAALEAVEWVECEAGMVRVCPWCKHSETTGHAADCEREAALAQARGEDA